MDCVHPLALDRQLEEYWGQGILAGLRKAVGKGLDCVCPWASGKQCLVCTLAGFRLETGKHCSHLCLPALAREQVSATIIHVS